MSKEQDMTAGKLAIVATPVIILAAGVSALMAAKSYEIIRMANAKGKKLEQNHD